MTIKGSTKIELTNVHTGQKEVIEHHNMVTNVMLIFNIKGGQLYVNSLPNGVSTKIKKVWLEE